ncbi:MAG: hypothetical protein IPM91_14105 [Bacteroidetes bacterium]|nr:hypothetical protein [Bacteroidota bacterium]
MQVSLRVIAGRNTKFLEAEKTLNETMLQNRELGFLQREMESRLGLAKVYLLTGRFTQALEAVEIVYKFSNEVEEEGSRHQGSKARCEVLMGKAAIGLGNFKLAEEKLEAGLCCMLSFGNVSRGVQAAESLIDVYNKTGKYPKAMDRLNFLLALKDTLALKDAERIKMSLEDRQNILMQNSKINLLMAEQEKINKDFSDCFGYFTFSIVYYMVSKV